MLTAIILACILAAITPFISFFTSKWIEDGKRKRAFRRLQSEPLLRIGSKVKELYTPNHGQSILKNGVVSDLSVGRVEFCWKEDGEYLRTSFTGQEVEQLIWVVRDE